MPNVTLVCDAQTEMWNDLRRYLEPEHKMSHRRGKLRPDKLWRYKLQERLCHRGCHGIGCLGGNQIMSRALHRH